MAYDFDVRALLNAFDGDPEKLANAFADALNEELANQRKVDDVRNAAVDVAGSWECFIDEYFAVHELPKGADIEDFYVDGDDVVALLEVYLKLVPYLETLHNYLTVMENTLKKTSEVVTRSTKDSFEDTMEKFFKKYNIE